MTGDFVVELGEGDGGAVGDLDIRVDLAKETARPRHFFRRRKNDPG